MITMRTITLTLTGLVTAWVLAGCASSSGYKQADKTGQGIADFHQELVNLKKAVDGTLGLLDQTTETAATDPRKAFEAFSKSIDKVEGARAKSDKRASAMRAAGDAYFEQWEAQLAAINNPDIRKLAEERKAKLSEIFSKLPPLMEQAKTRFDPFLSDLKDLRSFLSQDLTVAGVDAAKDIIRKTRAHGDTLQESLDGLIAEMNSISAALTPSKTAAK